MKSKCNRQILCYVVILLFQVSVTFEDIRVYYVHTGYYY